MNPSTLRTSDIPDLLRRFFPSLYGEVISRRGYGDGKSVWSIGDFHVLRYANSLPDSYSLRRERKLLYHLQGLTTIALPVPVFVAPDGMFDILRKAPGEPFGYSRWQEIDQNSQKRIAEQFGQFLGELHTAVPVRVATSFGYSRGFWPPSPQWTKTRLEGHLPLKQQELLDALLNYTPGFYDEEIGPVFLHDDFSHHNVGLTEDGRQVVGVFDFTNARIGDPHRDLRYAYTFEPFAETMISTYENTSNIKLSRDRLRVMHALSAFGFLAYDLTEGNVINIPLRWGWVNQVSDWEHNFLH